jgi:predicted nucleotidyltransferase
MVDEPTVALVRRYLRQLREQGLAVSFGVVFGSYARGEPGIWSDIDLLVISPRFDRRRSRDDVNLLWRVAARTDSRIEPIPCGDRQWQEDRSSPIVEVARREGQTVTA